MAAHAEKTAILSFYVKYIFLKTAKSGLLKYSSCAMPPHQNHNRVQLYCGAWIDLIFIGSYDFVFVERDDPKVVGDCVGELSPFVWQGFAKEP